MATIEIINKPGLLYRVSNNKTNIGCWYNQDASESGVIHTLKEGVAASLPMGFNEVFGADGKKWLSCTDQMANLFHWFSRSDMIELYERGYELEEIAVSSYRRLTFDTYGHEVFSDDDVVSRRVLEHMNGTLKQ